MVVIKHVSLTNQYSSQVIRLTYKICIRTYMFSKYFNISSISNTFVTLKRMCVCVYYIISMARDSQGMRVEATHVCLARVEKRTLHIT